ncbi:hypothetical protein N0V93_001248 [Gnomoniopsis smithogilvyi]|uniref:Uncharacterized protein n=1 Tax=Gnomoniopsis smithogilvyi TaxID=1191159 RepID=A0A9W9D225_9PEZI|nr:hypothetical protein N0V93_001248 [Gnomoniopsis smithogilvyi]
MSYSCQHPASYLIPCNLTSDASAAQHHPLCYRDGLYGRNGTEQRVVVGAGPAISEITGDGNTQPPSSSASVSKGGLVCPYCDPYWWYCGLCPSAGDPAIIPKTLLLVADLKDVSRLMDGDEYAEYDGDVVAGEGQMGSWAPLGRSVL